MGKMDLGSSVNVRSGLLAVGASRPEDGNSQEPVALETAVVATGARPGDTAAKRELFTEETVTVLVFEHGAVIRLSAAVADGQLLFLSNKKTGKEVVTQVMRKRAFRPTNCYVDLEFTEACPGFWGIEFPKSGVVANEASAAPAKDLAEELDHDAEPAKAAAAPSGQEVDRLKVEVAELQTQLKTLLQTGQGGKAGAKAASEISAERAKKEEEQQFEELFAPDVKQEESQLPKRLVAYSEKSTEKSPAAGGRGKIIFLAAAVIALAAIGAYQFGILDSLTKKLVVARPAHEALTHSQSAALAAGPIAQKPAAASVPKGIVIDNSSPATAAQSNTDKNSAAVPSGSSTLANESGIKSAPENAATKSPSSAAKTSTAASYDAKPAGGNLPGGTADKNPSTAAAGNTDSAAVSANTTPTNPAGVADDYVAPKLLKAVRPVAPAEALRNYVTGNVNADLLVDPTGHVKSVTIVSGPEKLRPAAVDFAKQYVYEPAKHNGNAVSAHVQVSLQFWYEP
jgi:hypothetical protein